MSIFYGLDDIIDRYLQLNENWQGKAPRYRHRATLLRLCDENGPEVDGVGLVHELYDRILANWTAWEGPGGLPTEANWRFEKRLAFNEQNLNPETVLERTIALVVDDQNWANQVPVDSGLLDGRAHWIDLVFRAGSAFSLIELKYESNTPLSAAFQILKYGLVFAFSQSHSEVLGINLDGSPLLQASEIHLRALAPLEFFTAYGPDLSWLSRFERAIHEGLERFSRNSAEKLPLMSFGFEAFPADFVWTPETAGQVVAQKEVLWAIHRRDRVFGK